MSIRISWLSNSALSATGYGNQTALFVPRIKELGHDISIFAFYGCEGSMLNWNGITMYPKHQHPYGQDIAGAHAKHFGADCILTLIDAWVMEPEQYEGIPWVAWAPVDMEPMPARVAEKLRRADVAIAYSRFGEAAMRDAGLDPLYVPHGVDTNVFRPIGMAEARAKLGWPMDKFVVGMVAANKGYPSRKAYPEQIAAFATFKKQHPDAFLWLHTTVGEDAAYGGVPLASIAQQCGLRPGVDVGWCDQYRYIVGGHDGNYMATLYSAFDVFLNVAYGEGFGIPILEAQACGTPVIVGDWTAMPELCFSGWRIPRERSQPVWSPLIAWQYAPHPDVVAEALNMAYGKTRDEAFRAQARERALAYDADAVTEQYWKPVLAEVERRLSRPKLVAGPIVRAA